MSQPTCMTCPYYFKLNRECRANPPIGVPMMEQGPMGQQKFAGAMGFYPATNDTGWCGKHPDVGGAKVVSMVGSAG